MAHEELIRDVVERVTEWLRDGLAAELAHLVEEAAAQVRAAVETEVRAALAEELRTRVAAARAEAERAVEERWQAKLAALQEEAEERVRAARREAEAQADERVRAVRAEAEQILAAELAQARRDTDVQLAEALASARADAAAAVVASVGRLVEASRRLDTARSLTDVLSLVADGAATEAARVAVFLVQGGRARGWRFVGFGPEVPDPKAVDVVLADAWLLGRAAGTGATVHLPGPAELSWFAPPLGLESGQTAVAAPVMVGGRVVALLYADDGGERGEVASAVWPQAVEVLARHAGRALEALTALRTAQVVARASAGTTAVPAGGQGAASAAGSPQPSWTRPGRAPGSDDDRSAQRYARLLVSEIKLYHEAEVRLGREHRDLARRLKGEIERARRLYEERVPAEIRARTSYFEDELVRTLADGDSSLLGQPH